jgi:GTP-binding protein EngB required for normal cell division
MVDWSSPESPNDLTGAIGVEKSAQPISVFPPTAEMPSLGVEGDALVDEVIAALGTLHKLTEHSELLGVDTTTSIRSTAKQVVQRLSRTELCVVLAGEPGAGKRTFLDALIGDPRVGKARGRTSITTFLRRDATPSFRARFADGKVVDFARLVPDQQRQMDQRLVSAEDAFEHAEGRYEALVLKAESARDALAKDEAELERQREMLNATRETVRSLEAMLGGAEMAAQRAADHFAAVQRSVPALATPARELGFFALLWQWIYKLFYLQRWQRVEQAARQRDEAAERFLAMKTRMQEADQACVDIEDCVVPLRVAVETKVSQAGAAEHVLPAAAKAMAEARANMEAERQALGRYVEERQTRFFAELAKISSAHPKPEVLQLDIDYPTDFVPDEVAIIDAPGVTDESGKSHAWEVIREQADGCILISDLAKGISAPTERFLNRLREVVPHVLLVLTKMDAAFVDATHAGEKEPWHAVEKARRARTQRFAEQIGRSPETVLSIAVAAQAVVEDSESGLAQRFETEIRKLFRLLRFERAIILGTRAAKVLRECLSRIAEAEKGAEASYRARIRALEAEHVPEPEVFHRQALAKSAAGIDRAAQRAIVEASEAVRQRFADLRRKSGDNVRASVHDKRFREVALGLEQDVGNEVRSVETQALLALEASAEQSIRELERKVFQELRQRYRIDEEVRRGRDSFHRPDVLLLNAALPTHASVRSAIRRHVFKRVLLGILGAILGGGIGMLLAPWIGAAVGIVLGPLLSFAKTHRSIERKTIALLEVELRKQEQAVLREVAALEQKTRSNVHAALNQSIEDVIIRYGRFIAVPFQAGEEAIAKERANLGRLRELGEAMVGHDEKLTLLMGEAALASRGLCQ